MCVNVFIGSFRGQVCSGGTTMAHPPVHVHYHYHKSNEESCCGYFSKQFCGWFWFVTGISFLGSGFAVIVSAPAAAIANISIGVVATCGGLYILIDKKRKDKGLKEATQQQHGQYAYLPVVHQEHMQGNNQPYAHPPQYNASGGGGGNGNHLQYAHVHQYNAPGGGGSYRNHQQYAHQNLPDTQEYSKDGPAN
jgi:hypothetical protein